MSLIIKLDPIMTEDHLRRAIPYVMNEKKTDGLSFSNVGMTAEQITDAFMRTKKVYHTTGKREGYHFKFSFSKDETITPEQAFEFVKEWAEQYLGDDYDYVVSAHSDRDHVHMHLVFNSVNHHGKKFNFANGDWEKIIKPLTNSLAEKYHTGPLKEKDKTLDYSSDYKKTIKGGNESWGKRVERDIDNCIRRSKSYGDFKRRMQVDYHYKLREGVSKEHGLYLSLTPPGKGKAIRTYRLGKRYSPEQIEKRIYHQRGKALDWKVTRTSAYIPYDQLSDYQRLQVRKMLEARRLYQRTNTSLQMHEQSVKAIRGFIKECKSYTLEPVKFRLPKKQEDIQRADKSKEQKQTVQPKEKIHIKAKKH